ncbi:MAG: hypothetical protein U0236_16040 [Nitrospira sp.]
MLMTTRFVRGRGKRPVYGDRRSVLIYGGVLLFCIVLVGTSGCASPERIDLISYDPSQDQAAIAGYYRNQAEAMREKANAQAIAAARYEALFGPEADLVSGARLLGQYYEQTAKELEGLAEAHASAARKVPHPPVAP